MEPRGSGREDRVIEYDPEADILVVKLRRGRAVDSEWLDNDIVLLYDEHGGLLEVEIHRARSRGLAEAALSLLQSLGLAPRHRKPAAAAQA